MTAMSAIFVSPSTAPTVRLPDCRLSGTPRSANISSTSTRRKTGGASLAADVSASSEVNSSAQARCGGSQTIAYAMAPSFKRVAESTMPQRFSKSMPDALITVPADKMSSLDMIFLPGLVGLSVTSGAAGGMSCAASSTSLGMTWPAVTARGLGGDIESSKKLMMMVLLLPLTTAPSPKMSWTATLPGTSEYLPFRASRLPS